MKLNSSSKIHITGGLGFIGSNLTRYLNQNYGIRPILYDKLDSVGDKWKYVADFNCEIKDDSTLDTIWGVYNDTLIHLGASVDTCESFSPKLLENNVTRPLRWFPSFGRIIYASSAAVYGAEEEDFRERLDGLTPLNAYAFTKLSLDRAVAGITSQPIVGLRLFNCYGPHEAHKGKMSSVVHQALFPGDVTFYPPNILTRMVWTPARASYRQTDLHWSLFKSERPDIPDGAQSRDFVHVDDVCSVICHFAGDAKEVCGIYNVGTGNARTFKELVRIVNPDLPIRYRDMPSHLKTQYQYRTCADLTKLRASGYDKPFLSLEEGIAKMRGMSV